MHIGWRLIFLGALLSLIGCAVKKPPPLPPFPNAELLLEIHRLNLEVEETHRGVVVRLPTIFFGFNNADLQPEARQKVEALSALLNHPRAVQRRIVVEGHADAIGPQGYNLKLSRQRAETVVQEMIANQLQRDRLRSEGFGETRPIAPNKNPDGSDNPKGRAQNRRVEVIIEN